jgi:hypothetical protein
MPTRHPEAKAIVDERPVVINRSADHRLVVINKSPVVGSETDEVVETSERP